MSLSEDDSTSDEEYIPPVKASKLEEDSESEYSDESESGNSDCISDSFTGQANEKRPAKRNSKQSKISDCSPLSAAEDVKAYEDKVWDEFLKSGSTEKSNSSEKVNVVKKYQFAGEEVEVIQTVSNSNRSILQNKTSSETNPLRPKAPHLGLGLSNALQNLKSTINSLPRLSTLEKSRLDWKQYVEKESLEDDLKAHNKGKEGYLERQAFFNRASEREYQYERQLKKSTSSRKT
ncbi:unnamed protein product [Schistosoma rodhaini]|uniref:BCNT-C domain-containing protein n=1 Tax=Schistosoma rodhaini TaxID=6188 RepID=A0A183RT49_9TREM|nr:unnamed protein product [Schistosoma rodhaini]